MRRLDEPVMGVDEPCEQLAWDTDFWGFSVARVRGDTLTSARADRVVAWSRDRGMRCVYFRARADSPETMTAATSRGFQWVDLQITLQRETSGREALDCAVPAGVAIGAARDSDVPLLRAIARESYGDTRFYFDQHFPRPLCDRLYEVWIANSCAGGAQMVLVAAENDRAVGYVTCHLEAAQGDGKIGLVGMAAEARGRGIGTALIDQSLRWFSGQGIDRVSVVTQGRNVAAQRLYQRAGFLTASTAVWLHWWDDAA